MIHVTCPSIDNAEDDLKEYVNQLFKDYHWTSDEISADVETETLRQVVWSMYFTIPACEKCMTADKFPFDGVHVACAPFFELDYDRSIEQVRLCTQNNLLLAYEGRNIFSVLWLTHLLN